ncbi:MAG TPA: shikimate dehydrogenase, partial [Thermomicrobiales bacterium]|nr:shikimate dehydrogenase [Thermomicrobiales bacterium]
ALVDEVAPAAARAGAVNTIVNRDGRLLGDNTDIDGFATALAETCPDVATRPALLLGAGGAARAVALVLEALAAPAIALANRDPARAERLAVDLAIPRLETAPFDDATLRRRLPGVRLLVNCTSLGWKAGETPLAGDLLALLPDDALVADLTYRQTELLQRAADRGLATLDGLAMLVHQGARAFSLWTGQPAPTATMFAAARAARAASG